jgi:hypothetical protein
MKLRQPDSSVLSCGGSWPVRFAAVARPVPQCSVYQNRGNNLLGAESCAREG